MKTPIIFDNDCISSFLWVNRVDIIKTVFPKQIIVPMVVYNEIKKVNYIYRILDSEVNKKEIEIVDLEINSNDFNEYIRLISPENQMQIDPGEAAAIVIAKKLNHDHKWILKKLCERAILQNRDATVTSLVKREDVQRYESRTVL